MSTKRSLKLRIRATRNVGQITRAMEAVSAVKLRRSQAVALGARPFAIAALRLMRNLRAYLNATNDAASSLLERRPPRKTFAVVVTSDRGLSGPFNANVARRAEAYLRSKTNAVSLVTVGKRGMHYFRRRGVPVVAEFFGIGDLVHIEEARPIAVFLERAFRDGTADEIVCIYTNFLTALRQEVVVRTLLPIEESALAELVAGIVPVHGRFAELHKEFSGTAQRIDYMFEPSPQAALEVLLPELFLAEVFHCLVEANASEHSSRLLAMRNASENAEELLGELTVLSNKARQSQINKELAEISGGAEALAS